MTEYIREHGVYSSGSSRCTSVPPSEVPASAADRVAINGLAGRAESRIKPGICLPWEEKAKQLPEITGDRDLIKRMWEQIDVLGNTFIWQLLLSF